MFSYAFDGFFLLNKKLGCFVQSPFSLGIQMSVLIMHIINHSSVFQAGCLKSCIESYNGDADAMFCRGGGWGELHLRSLGLVKL